MALHLPTLVFVCIAMLALSASVMTLFGCTQRVYRGFWWWTTAQWLAALGLLLYAGAQEHPVLQPVAHVLLLQWPVLTLGGLRRFYPRESWPVGPEIDWILLGGAFLLWLVGWALDGTEAARIVTLSAGLLALHAYCIVMLVRLPAFAESPALKVLVGAHALSILLLAARVISVGWLGATEAVLAAGLLPMLIAVVMIYLGLMLTCERTERDLRASQRRLQLLANMDMLTEVPNRRYFQELAAQAMQRCTPGSAAMVMCDIDHFKLINDRLGHAHGDRALCIVARCIQGALRSGDVAGRLGGDEFVLLLPETPVHDAMTVASRIVTQLDSLVGDADHGLSLSFGVVQMAGDESIAEAIRRADQALYEAKRQGRKRAVIATGEEEGLQFSESHRLGLTMQ
jgi:diguanylate cyclase (GGDEF)-like protein